MFASRVRQGTSGRYIQEHASRLTFLEGSTPSSGAGTTITRSAISLGTASANRRIAVAVAWRRLITDQQITGITVGGTALSLDVQSNTGNQAFKGEIWSALVPTGTTGDVVVTWSVGDVQAVIGIYRIQDAILASSGTASLTATSINISTTLPVGGVRICAHTNNAIDDAAEFNSGVTQDRKALNIGDGNDNTAMIGSATTRGPNTTAVTTTTGTSSTRRAAVAAYRFR